MNLHVHIQPWHRSALRAAVRLTVLVLAISAAAPQASGCLTFSLNIPNGRLKHGPGEETGTLQVSQGRDCTWSRRDITVSWLRIVQSREGTISYTVDPNPGNAPRKATINFSATSLPPPYNRPYDYTFAFDIVQDGQSPPRCSVTAAGTALSTGPSANNNLSLLISTDWYCEWTATVPPDASWITIVRASNLGQAFLALAVTANTASVERTATVTITPRDLDASGNPPAPLRIQVTQNAGGFRYSVTRDGGGVYFSTGNGDLKTGSGSLTSTTSLAPPTGLAIFGYRNGGVFVSEATVPASRAFKDGRIAAEMEGSVNTGLALYNPYLVSATVTFTFTDTTGRDVGLPQTLEIPARAKIAAFLTEAPFNGPRNFRGTLTFRSSAEITAIALRGLFNLRSDFLITTLPVIDLSRSSRNPLTFPHFAEGLGWSSQIVLVNPTDTTITGTVFVVPARAAATEHPYSIPARSSWRLRVPGVAGTLISGWMAAIPSTGMAAPGGVVIFSYTNSSGTTISEAGVQPAQLRLLFDTYKLYAETTGTMAQFNSGTPGAMQTGFAVVNIETNSADVRIELVDISGRSVATRTVSVPALSQRAQFVGEMFSAELQSAFKGFLRITGPVAVAGLRFRNNERGDVIYTTLPAVQYRAANFYDVHFPHVVDGGGYSTQFVLLETDSSYFGELRLYSHDGTPMSFPLTQR